MSVSQFSRRALLHAAALTATATTGVSIASAAHAGPTFNRTAPNRIKSVAYIEVNDNSLLNVGKHVLDDSSPAFDFAIIFAANINYDGNEAYLHLNENVQRVLDEAETQIRPLQAMGIKVLLSVLGNHQGAGFANFPTRKAADKFAKSVADVVNKYGLDGVDLDDEWAEYGVNGTGQPNEFSFIYLLRGLRKYLPSKTITFYVVGPSARATRYNGITAGDLVDYAWNPYYNNFFEIGVPGLENNRFGPAAVDLSTSITPRWISNAADKTVKRGYGAFVTYQLKPGNQTKLITAFTEKLYGSKAHYLG